MLLAVLALPLKVAATTAEGTAAALNKEITQSVFQEADPFTTHDPFSPIGYKRLMPKEQGTAVKPQVDFKDLKVNAVTIAGDDAIATLTNGQILEVGNTYPYKAKDVVVQFKVMQIKEGLVVILYDGEEYELTSKSGDLNSFIEKEEPNENTKP